MYLHLSARPTAFLTAMLAISACDPLSYDGKIANSADANLEGCKYLLASCNDTTYAGVVAKIEGDPETGDLSIRFFTLKDNEDTTYTYDDGQSDIVLDATLSGTDAELSEISLGLLATAGISGYTSVTPSQDVLGFFGYQTDASVIRTDGVAVYYGDAVFSTVNSGSGTGISALSVDFGGSGDADLYAAVTSGTIVSFDEMRALNMTIDGYTFTGDEVILLLEDAPVDLDSITGNDTRTASAGMFFGPVDGDGTPIEYGAVAIISGDADKVLLLSAGSVDAPPPP